MQPEQTLPLEDAADEVAQVPAERRDVTAHQGHPPARASTLPVGDPMAMMQIMERMAKNKEVDPAKLTQIREFGEAILADQRRTAFDAAFSAMQADLPTITAKGTIEIREKGSGPTGRIIQSTKYAKWEDINDAIKPVLQRHGFSLRFVTGLADDGRVKVTGILGGHGHREESVFILPHDSTGSKNAVQAIGSSTSYGKRYAACALLNITTRGEDDDASSFVDQDDRPKISTKQIDNLMDLCDSKGCPRPKFLKHIGAEAFKDIPAADYEAHIALLNTYGPK
jgi:hypothetical protein